jgi:4-nitrophenyl phosphatase
MLERLLPPIRGLILDMDGVLWKDDVPIGNLPSIFDRIRARGMQVALATNNATKTVEEYLLKLAGFGVRLESSQIVTSSEATAYSLAKTFPKKGRVFVVGENGITSALRDKGFTPVVDPDDDQLVVAVVAGIDRMVTYHKLRRATLQIRAGAPFYGTNGDKTFPTPSGLVPGAGAILAALEAATDVKPTVIGKPAPWMLELSAERIGLGKTQVLVVGDRLETDIAGGQAMGARTALVLSGVSTREQAAAWQPPPDIIAKDLASLVTT